MNKDIYNEILIGT